MNPRISVPVPNQSQNHFETENIRTMGLTGSKHLSPSQNQNNERLIKKR